MQPLRPSTKAGIVAGGFVASLAAAGLAVWVRQRLVAGPDAQASSGMQAFGDLLLGLAVFGTLSLGPFALALYWLRPFAWFWQWLTRATLLFILTGPLALAVSGPFRMAVGSWALLADARIGLMPPTALALAISGLFAPQGRPRGILVIAGVMEGGIIATLVLAKFILPQLGR